MPQLPIQQTFNLALQNHQAGRLQEADQLYRQILERQPDHAGALHYLGVLSHQQRQNETAIPLIRRAIALAPNQPEPHNNLGLALKETGQHDAAIASYQKAIALRPNYPSAYYNLGIAYDSKQRFEQSIAAYRQAIALKPNYAEAYFNLASAFRNADRLDEAIAAYQRAIALRPNDGAAYNNLGDTLRIKGQFDAAIAALREAIKLDANDADAHYNLGNAFRDSGQLKQAIVSYRSAIASRPGDADSHYNLGHALLSSGDIGGAIAALRQAIVLNPDLPQAYNNLAAAMKENGQFEESIAACRSAIALRPDYADAYNNLAVALRSIGQTEQALHAYRKAVTFDPAKPALHTNLAYALLAAGHFSEGWEEQEWRWKCSDFPSPPRNFPQPQWNGQPLSDRTILLHPEQGLGDAIQFVRYLPLVATRARRIVVECQPQLQTLFRSIAQRVTRATAVECQIVSMGQHLPPFDIHCPLLTLPLVFKTALESIPAEVPYLFPEPDLLDYWRDKLSPSGRGLKIALNWAGNPNYRGDRERSISLQQLAPLTQVPGAVFYSVQKGDAAKEADQPPAGMRLVNLSPDFDNTAAVMSLMDLVITTDTSIAHLAGALGRPTWLMLQFTPDWRWLLHREDCPWYPSMRLFRQQRLGDWDSVIQRVADSLTTLANNHCEHPR